MYLWDIFVTDDFFCLFTIPLRSRNNLAECFEDQVWEIGEIPFLSSQNDSLALPSRSPRYHYIPERRCYVSDQSQRSKSPCSVAFSTPAARLVRTYVCDIFELLRALGFTPPSSGNGPWQSCRANHPSIRCANPDTNIPNIAWPA